jgi:DNA-binding NarL/FixJ family response regulator
MPPSRADEGLRVARSLRETHPEIGVVVLSQYAEPAYALGLFDGGTGRRAYLLKERIRDREELVGAIEKVAKGGSVIDPLVVDVLIQARSRASHSRLTALTAREREVLAEIAAGKSNAAVAESLVLSKRAVEKHVNSIFSKLDLPDTEDVSRRVKATLLFLDEEEDDADPPQDFTLARRAAHRSDHLRSSTSSHTPPRRATHLGVRLHRDLPGPNRTAGSPPASSCS